MKTKLFTLLILVTCLAVAGGSLAAAGSAPAESTAASIGWQVFSSGGAPSSAGNISLNGSLGQSAIGPVSSNQASLWAGFWAGARKVVLDIFLPLITKNQ